MIAIWIETVGESILEFAAVNEDNEIFHICRQWHVDRDTFISTLGPRFVEWLGSNDYDIVAVDFHNSIKPFLLKVPNFPIWNPRVLDLTSLYFDGISVPRLWEIDSSVRSSDACGIVQAIMKAFLKKKRELLS